MAEHPVLLGLFLFIGGVVTTIFHKPLARISGRIDRAIGKEPSGEEYYSFRQLMNIIGGILCAIGGLLLMLGVIHFK